jgi:hypothetical protein
MITESDIEAFFAETVLGIIKNPVHKTNVNTFCSEYHIDRNKLTSKQVFSMNNRTLFRLMMGIAQLASLKEYLIMCYRFAKLTYQVANREDGSPEAILRAHAGSPIKRKRQRKHNKS